MLYSGAIMISPVSYPVSAMKADTGKNQQDARKPSSTACAVHRMLYQGEELGMTNTDFTDISQFKDVESLNHYQILQDKGLSASDALRIIQIHSRDNGRTPMQWDASQYAGFTSEDSKKPWIAVNSNHEKINAADQLKDEDSIFHYYQKLIALRKTPKSPMLSLTVMWSLWPRKIRPYLRTAGPMRDMS